MLNVGSLRSTIALRSFTDRALIFFYRNHYLPLNFQ
jgi:hypothetical protein